MKLYFQAVFLLHDSYISFTKWGYWGRKYRGFFTSPTQFVYKWAWMALCWRVRAFLIQIGGLLKWRRSMVYWSHFFATVSKIFLKNILNSDYLEYFGYFCCWNEQGYTCTSYMPDRGWKTARLVLRQYLCSVFCLDTGTSGSVQELSAPCRAVR